jgi:biotin carboxyl carrier protein
MKSFRITLGDKIHHVTVELLGAEPAPAAAVPSGIVSPAASPQAPVPAPRARGESGEVRSPLSGKLVSFDVKAGQRVEEGAQVATIEAMKMNTYVFAPKGGTVTTLAATPGEAVEENETLLFID